MPATAETLLDFLKNNPNPMRLAENFPMVRDAFQDLLDRVVYLEKSYLEQRFNQQQTDARLKKLETTLREYDRDHAEVKQRVQTAEQEPNRSAERLDQFEQRLRAVEGATGQRIKDERDAGHPDRPAFGSLTFASTTPNPTPPPPPKPDKPDPQPTPGSGPSDKQEREPAKADA